MSTWATHQAISGPRHQPAPGISCAHGRRPHHLGHHLSTPAPDRGSATVELTVIFPVLLLLILGLVQGGLYWHSRNVALAAAQEGLAATRVEAGTTTAGTQRTLSFINQAGGTSVLTNVAVTPTRSATTATVQVTGSAIPLIPGLFDLRITVTAGGPVERYQSP